MHSKCRLDVLNQLIAFEYVIEALSKMIEPVTASETIMNWGKSQTKISKLI